MLKIFIDNSLIFLFFVLIFFISMFSFVRNKAKSDYFLLNRVFLSNRKLFVFCVFLFVFLLVFFAIYIS